MVVNQIGILINLNFTLYYITLKYLNYSSNYINKCHIHSLLEK